MNKFFQLIVKNREVIITLFKIAYILLSVITIFAGYELYKDTDLGFTFYSVAKDAGEVGILLYILTAIPGIFRRFRLNYKLLALLMIFRRYIGLLTFFVIVYHYTMMRGITNLKEGINLASYSTFELFGVAAFSCLFLLAITSNDLSTNKLGAWWGRIHSLTYLTLYIIILHVGLQKIGTWSILIATVGLLQAASFIFKWRKSAALQAK